MYFVDAVGNMDSLTLGNDITATDSVDAAFGENNIIFSPYAAGLDVRAGNLWLQQNFGTGIMGTPGIFGYNFFQTKKQTNY